MFHPKYKASNFFEGVILKYTMVQIELNNDRRNFRSNRYRKQAAEETIKRRPKPENNFIQNKHYNLGVT